jgi:hypothetical protein
MNALWADQGVITYILHQVQDVTKKSFTMVFEILLCGECYENVYT